MYHWLKKNFKLRRQLFYWIFKSLSYDERNHKSLIIEYMKNFRLSVNQFPNVHSTMLEK